MFDARIARPEVHQQILIEDVNLIELNAIRLGESGTGEAGTVTAGIDTYKGLICGAVNSCGNRPHR